MAPLPHRTAEGGQSIGMDSNGLSSDDGSRGNLVPSPLSADDANWTGTPSTTPLRAGQFSPTGGTYMDASMDGSSTSTIGPSVGSSCDDLPSSSTGDQVAEHDLADAWDQETDNLFKKPKSEPSEDDLNLDAVTAAPDATAAAQTDASMSDVKLKRPRGRPRKHPITPLVVNSKVTKGRSKTGCITCRKRKKKCDEAKPRCMNCEKNAVVCEGYHEKQIWKSGKERAEEDRLKQDSLPGITMQPIFHGVETAEDKVFWKHYINCFSNVLSVEGEARNAFKDIILPLANEHQGLMHSILAVSSKHIDYDDPYGSKLLQENPDITRGSLQDRSDYHHDAAMRRLYEDMAESLPKDDPEYQTVLCARYGQMLCLLLQTRAEGNPRGEHRVHLQAYQTLIQQSPPEDPAFRTFIMEFFQYHIYADDLFWHPETMTGRLASEDWTPPSDASYPPRLLGVTDGLFQGLCIITTMRNTIRSNINSGTEPTVDYSVLYQAAEIDAAIRQWSPQWPPGDHRERVSLLYKQMMWVYLFRTIYPPNAASYRRSTVSTFGLGRNMSLMPGMPPRRASMLATVGGPLSAHVSPHPSPQIPGTGYSGAMVHPQSLPSSRHPSRTSSMHESDGTDQQVLSPAVSQHSNPQLRPPSRQDQRITVAVEESLQILESIKPSDPVQTLLLIPCMVIGTACFDPTQQERLRAAVKAVRGYTGLRNCDRVLQVLEQIWSLMAEEDWLTAWDWQGVSREMDLGFLCT